ncbi:acyltransferase [Motilimonas pumila]|uniref:Fucose 4-O-acetylase n=1 Tax=Motilimonas pumila TaxID=2303987 RepID=A0A418YHY4_9GAMM|nr:acyltransferase family protein [Motilimonas pumila]RJG49939.1 fucose 4-O-acetylase [Motilimonas pumila]
MISNVTVGPGPINQPVYSFYWAKVIATLAVVLLHSHAFMSAPLWQDVPWLGLFLNQVTRFAVPLFFVIAGYLIQPKLQRDPWSTLMAYAKPLLKLWLVWSLIYFALPFNLGTVVEHGYWHERVGYWSQLMQAPLNTLFEGGLVHLWYIPGLLSGLLVMAGLIASGRVHWIGPVALLLYAYALMTSSYQPFTGLESAIFPRNGPFFSTLMLVIGFWVRAKGRPMSVTLAFIVSLLGMALHLTEAFFLLPLTDEYPGYDFLFATPLWAYGLLHLCLALPQLGQRQAWLKSLSEATLGIYLVHLLVFIYYKNVLGMLSLSGYWTEFLATPVVFVVSYLIVIMLRKSPLHRLLLR